jgi:hypothetical protein
MSREDRQPARSTARSRQPGGGVPRQGRQQYGVEACDGHANAFGLAERLGSINAAATELGTPGRRCAKPSPATASACRPATLRSRQRAIAAARRPAGRPRPGPGLRSARPGRPPRPRTVVGPAVPVDPAQRAVRHLGRQRGGRAVQRTSRPPANYPGVGDHPTGRAQPPAGGPAHQPRRAPLRRPSRPHQPVAATPGVADAADAR